MATNFTIAAPVYIATAAGSVGADMTSGGTWTATANANASFVIQISTAAGTDQFQWSMNGGAFSAGIPIVAGPIGIVNGLTVTFVHSTGHVVGDIWTIEVTAAPMILGQLLRQRGFGGGGVSLQDLMHETIHVDRFGAVPDASTDSTAGIQNALNYATQFRPGTANGGKVRLGRGVYMVSSTIVIPRGVQLLGETPYSSIIRASSSFPSSAWNSFVVSMAGQTFPGSAPQLFSGGLADLTIDCGEVAYGYTPAARISALLLTGPEEGTLLERIYLLNHTDYGLAALSPSFNVENLRGGDLWILARPGATQYKSIFLFVVSSRAHFYSITVASLSATASVYPGITLIGCQTVKLDHIHPEQCPIGVYVVSAQFNNIENVYGNPTVPITVQIDPDPASVLAWVNTTAYLMGDVVSQSGSNYLCAQNNTGQAPSGGAPYWAPFAASTGMQVKTVAAAGGNYALIDYRQSSINPSAPAYVSSTTYARLAQVSYSGVLYVGIQVSGNMNHTPDSSPAWWMPGTPVFSVLDTYLDASCLTQPMGFKNRTGFGFDTFQDYPATTIEVMAGAIALTSPDCGIRLRRWVPGSGYAGIGFPAALGHVDLAIVIEPATDDLILCTYNNASPGVFVRLHQASGDVSVDSGHFNVSIGAIKINGTTVIDASKNGTLASLALTSPLAIANGGTGAATGSAARTALSAVSRTTGISTVAGTAGATYTSAEQTILNNLVTAVNAIIAALNA